MKFSAADTDELEVLPSGEYAVKQIDGTNGPVLQLLQYVDGSWHVTPGQWYASTLQQHTGLRLAIDFGQGWALSIEDTDFLVTYAHHF